MLNLMKQRDGNKETVRDNFNLPTVSNMTKIPCFRLVKVTLMLTQLLNFMTGKKVKTITGLPLFFVTEILGVLGEFRRKIDLFLGEIYAKGQKSM